MFPWELKKLKKGLLHHYSSCEDLEHFLHEKCRQILQQEEQDWVLSQLTKLQTEHDKTIASLSERYNEIRSTVQSARLKEINEHKKLFEGQKEVRYNPSLLLF